MTISKSQIKALVLEYMGEFVATMIMAFSLLLAPIMAGGIEPFFVAFTFMFMWIVFSPITKVHMNPAISFGFYLSSVLENVMKKKFVLTDLLKFLGYVMTQFLAFLAAYPIANWLRTEVISFQIVKNSLDDTAATRASLLAQSAYTTVYNDTFAGMAFFLEFMGAFIIIFTLLRLAKSEYQKHTGYVWGLAVFAVMILAIQITQASFNPFRSLIPAMFEGTDVMKFVPLYIWAPLAAAVVAVLTDSLMNWLAKPVAAKAEKKEEPKKKK